MNIQSAIPTFVSANALENQKKGRKNVNKKLITGHKLCVSPQVIDCIYLIQVLMIENRKIKC